MKLRISNIFVFTTKHHLITLFCTFLFAALFIVNIPSVQKTAHVDYYTVENENTRYYREFKKIFGNDEFFLIGVAADDVFSSSVVRVVGKITSELESMDDVREVTSLTNVDEVAGGEDFFEVRKLFDPDDLSEEKLAALKHRALRSKLYRDNLVASDGSMTVIVVFTYDRPDDGQYRKRLLTQVDQLLYGQQQTGVTFHLAGFPVVNVTLSDLLNHDSLVMFPSSLLLILFIIQMLFRNWRFTLIGGISIITSVGSVLGLFGLTGITFNNMTAVVLPVVVTLALADTIHILSHLDRKLLSKNQDNKRAMEVLLRMVVRPCLLTSIVTGIGFLSLSVSRIHAMREFAYMASAAMIFEFIYSFFLVPQCLLLCRPDKVFVDLDRKDIFGIRHFLEKLVGFIQCQRIAILVVCFFLALTGLWFTMQVRVETNILEYIKKSAPLRQDTEIIEERISGTDTINVSLRTNDFDGFKDPDRLRLIEEFQQYIERLPAIDYTISFVDFLKEMNWAFHAEDESYLTLPATREMVEQYLLLYDSHDIEDFMNDAYDHARILVRISEHGSTAQKEILHKMDDWMIQRLPPHDIGGRLTGWARNFVDVAEELVNGQINSFGLAAVVICLLMVIVFRSPSMGVLSLVPNLFPIFVCFGFMGLVGIPLDTGTVMTASVALGIACDDTIHFLTKYRLKRQDGMDRDLAVAQVVVEKGRAILSTSLIMGLGFGILITADFVPIVHFGLLCAVVLSTAVCGDLLLLPAIILSAPRRKLDKAPASLSTS